MTETAAPLLSVVIPTYDTASMTLACCRAVLASAAVAVEVIVADDASRDGTAELLATQLPKVRVVRLETNRGFAGAANRGVAAARGDIILLLNSDAIVEPHALTALLSAFANEPKLGVAGARLLDDDGTPQWSGGRTPTLAWMIAVVSGAGARLGALRRRRGTVKARQVDWVSGAAIAFRNEVWRDAGPLNERYFFYCQEIDFCLRARGARWDVRIVEEARVVHGRGRTIAPDDPLRYDPERMWPDLLQWGRAHYGKQWSVIAKMALVIAAAVRITTRLVRDPLLRDPATRTLLRAMRRLVQNVS